MHQKYPCLFSPLDIGGLTLKNRIIFAPLGMSHFAPTGNATTENIYAFEQRARSGAALITHPECIVDPLGDGIGAKYGFYNPGIIPDITKESLLIRRYGGVSSVSLCHHGGRSDPSLTPTGKIYGPSPAFSYTYGVEVTPMDEDMINYTVEAFAKAAHMSRFAGYDMVTIHGAHGFLFSQFLSPTYNTRKDRFGGSIENRSRFALMVVEAIRAKCGPDFPVEFRFSGDDFMEGGAHLDEMKEFARIMDGKVNILHVSASSFWNTEGGCARMIPSMFLPYGVNVYLAAEIKKVVKQTPVATVGSLGGPDRMEQILANGEADLVAAARAFFADPFWAQKAFDGRENDITPCVRCNVCISGNYVPFVPYPYGLRRCTVNPAVGMEWETHIPCKTGQPRRVLVIGGGPAGMQAALEAAKMGHQVTLWEKRDKLGGMINNFCGPEFKSGYRQYLKMMVRRLDQIGVTICLKQEATPQAARDFGADIIIAALGAEPMLPTIDGLDDPRVITVADLPREVVGSRIVVIGGGSAGAEEALSWAADGKQVTVIEATGKIAPDAPYVHRMALLLEYEKPDAPRIELNNHCTRIDENGVWAKDIYGRETCHAADAIFVATGMRPLRQQAESFRTCAKEFRIIGDCRQVHSVYQANKDGYNVARGLA